MEIPIGFSMSIILNWLAILAVLLSGYFLYLMSRERESEKTETETLLHILALGIFVVTIVTLITGILSVHDGGTFVNGNIYVGYGLYILIFISSFGIVFPKLAEPYYKKLVSQLKYFKNLILVSVFALLILFCIRFPDSYNQTFDKCNSELLMQPNLIEYNQSTMNDQLCKTICYDKYKISNISSTNVLNNMCYCDIHDCRNST